MHQMLHLVVGHRDGVGVEGVGLDDIGAGLQVFAMDLANHIRLRQGEQIVVSLQVNMPVLEAFTMVFFGAKILSLNHGAHGTVENENAFLQGLLQFIHETDSVIFFEFSPLFYHETPCTPMCGYCCSNQAAIF